MLTIRNVSVRFGERLALSEVCLELHAGQWLMLCGPNGAGKSTLARAVLGGVRYTGEIMLNGTNVRQIKPRQLARTIGVLRQQNGTGYAFTVEQVVEMGRYAYTGGLFSRGDPGARQAVERALEQTGLTGVRQQNVQTLSGGELQRVFLAQVLAQEPSILILDEPANHLDLFYQRQLMEWIAAWLQTPGRAVLSVVHDLSLARAYGTDAALLSAGRIVSVGKPVDALSRPILQSVYGLDVYEWTRALLSQWQDG